MSADKINEDKIKKSIAIHEEIIRNKFENFDKEKAYFPCTVEDRYLMILEREKKNLKKNLSPYNNISISKTVAANNYRFINCLFPLKGTITNFRTSKKEKYTLNTVFIENFNFVPGTAELYKGLFISVILYKISTGNKYFPKVNNLFNYLYDNNKDILTLIWETFSGIVYDQLFFGNERLSMSISLSSAKDLNKINIETNSRTNFIKNYFLCYGESESAFKKTFKSLTTNTPLIKLLSKMQIFMVCKTKCFNPDNLFNSATFKISFILESLNLTKIKYSNRAIEESIMDEETDDVIEEKTDEEMLSSLIKDTKKMLKKTKSSTDSEEESEISSESESDPESESDMEKKKKNKIKKEKESKKKELKKKQVFKDDKDSDECSLYKYDKKKNFLKNEKNEKCLMCYRDLDPNKIFCNFICKQSYDYIYKKINNPELIMSSYVVPTFIHYNYDMNNILNKSLEFNLINFTINKNHFIIHLIIY